MVGSRCTLVLCAAGQKSCPRPTPDLAAIRKVNHKVHAVTCTLDGTLQFRTRTRMTIADSDTFDAAESVTCGGAPEATPLRFLPTQVRTFASLPPVGRSTQDGVLPTQPEQFTAHHATQPKRELPPPARLLPRRRRQIGQGHATVPLAPEPDTAQLLARLARLLALARQCPPRRVTLAPCYL